MHGLLSLKIPAFPRTFAVGVSVSTVYFRFDASGGAAPQRAPWFERLLAGATAVPAAQDCRAQAFSLLCASPLPAIGPAAACGAFGALPAAGVCLATPIHTVAGMQAVHLPEDGLPILSAQEAGRLAEDFARVFAGGDARLAADPAGRLYGLFDRPLEALTRDPAQVRGGDIWEHLPAGRDGPRLRRLASEIEMWLHEHPLNRERAARGASVVTGLWLWGCGATLAALPPLHGFTAGRDALFGAWPSCEHWPAHAIAGVVTLAARPGEAGWEEAERCWLAPAAAALAAGRLRALLLSGGARCLRVGPRWRWQGWRTRRPWWRTFEQTPDPRA